MECDSMHSTIERKLRNREIYAPSGYFEVCRTARIKPRPFIVTVLDHKYFKKFSSMKAPISLRPGSKPGDPTVTNIRAIQYSPDGSVRVKVYSNSCEFEELPRRIKNINGVEVVPALYTLRLKIQASSEIEVCPSNRVSLFL